MRSRKASASCSLSALGMSVHAERLAEEGHRVGIDARVHLRAVHAGRILADLAGVLRQPGGAGRQEDPVVGLRHLVHARERERRSEEHTSELQSLMRNSYAVLCLK